jgi:hypothetical protein
MATGVYKRHPHQGFQKGHKDFVSPETRAAIAVKLRGNSWNVGKTLSETTKAKMSAAHKGVKKSLQHRINISKAKRGANCNFWKGGITPIHKALRSSQKYRFWREAVFLRDNWTCIICKQKGGRLNADHILPFAHYPALRFALNNGRTLCLPCHKKTDTFGGRAIKKRVLS